MTTRQKALIGCGLVVFAAGVFLPTGWFVPVPPDDPLPPPPISGFALVQMSLLAEGLILVCLAFWRWGGPITKPHLVPIPVMLAAPGEDNRVPGWLLLGITLLAFGLRVVSLGSDLWLDEFSVVVYGKAPAWQLLTAFDSFNNHLLNTLLAKASVGFFGEEEWAVRLPSMLWGTATIPALYWVARQAMSRSASLSAALLLAVSYHHIFFSQNARGYSAYVFLSLTSSALLIKGLGTDSPRYWAAYVATSVLNFAALLISGFVFAAHIIVSSLAVRSIGPGAALRRPMIWRLLGVFAATAFFGFQIYAAVLPQKYVQMRPTYADPAGGFSPFSLELVAELARGLAAGFGAGILLGALPFMCFAAVGCATLFKRHWVLAVVLALPCFLQALFFVSQSFTFYPRLFILALPLSILVAVQAITSAAEVAARLLKRNEAFAWWLRMAIVVLLCAASIAALPRYYATPKQPYRAALSYVDAARRPSGLVIVVHYAAAGIRYYGARTGLTAGGDYAYARTVEEFDAIVAAHPGRPVWLVTTLPRALRIAEPELETRITQNWEIERTFPATIGDGQISVWRLKQ